MADFDEYCDYVGVEPDCFDCIHYTRFQDNDYCVNCDEHMSMFEGIIHIKEND